MKTRTGNLAAGLKVWSEEGMCIDKFEQSSLCASSSGRLSVGNGMFDASDLTLPWGWILDGPGYVASKILFSYLVLLDG